MIRVVSFAGGFDIYYDGCYWLCDNRDPHHQQRWCGFAFLESAEHLARRLGAGTEQFRDHQWQRKTVAA